jgi:hypothetical protein
MEFALKPEATDSFEARMGEIGPWFHSYKFGESTYTGFYKHEGLSWDTTWCNSKSPPDVVARLRQAYGRRNLQPWKDLVAEAVSQTGLDPKRSAALDISSAGGRNSFILADLGFGKVVASEIREASHAQHKLIVNSIQDARYSAVTELVNDPTSADDSRFPDRYAGSEIDLACSFHLLYHLTNPAQHIINLHAITRRYALIFTKTHHQYALSWAGKRGWLPTIEQIDDPANAALGFGWTPSYWEVPRLARQAGFDLRWAGYLAPFEKNFPYFRRSPNYVLGRRLMEDVASRVLGTPVGFRRNLDKKYHGPFHVDPHYFMYVLEKSPRAPAYG